MSAQNLIILAAQSSQNIGGSCLWPDLRDAFIKPEGGLFSNCFPPSISKTPQLVHGVTTVVLLMICLHDGSQGSQHKSMDNAVLRGIVLDSVDHINAFLEMAVEEFDRLQLGCEALSVYAGSPSFIGALPYLPLPMTFLSKFATRGKDLAQVWPEIGRAWSNLVVSLYRQSLRCWPALLAVHDATTSAGFKLESHGLDAVRLFAAQPHAIQRSHWARHWACNLDVVSRMVHMEKSLVLICLEHICAIRDYCVPRLEWERNGPPREAEVLRCYSNLHSLMGRCEAWQ